MKIIVMVLLLTAWASTARAQADVPYRVSLAAAIAAHGADLATSEYCLGSGRCSETNSVMAHFSDQPAAFAAMKVGLTAVSLWCVSKLRENHRTLAIVMNYSMAAAFTAIAAHNAREISRFR
jgi:uncharacterized protein DUF5658